MRQKLIAVLLVIVVALSAFAQAAKPSKNDAPKVDKLREIVTYLASDQLEGRRTGSPGATLAAEYIANAFQNLGLSPGVPVSESHPEKKKYGQVFPYVAGVDLGSNNALSVNVGPSDIHRTQVGTDWQPLGFSTSTTVTWAGAVFAGYGLTVSELKYDDYAGADVKGKIAVVLAGTPDGENPHGQFANFSDVRWKAIAAKDKGAKALLIIAREKNFADDRLSVLRFDNLYGDAGLPVVAVSQQVAVDILRQTFPGVTVDANAPDLATQIIPQKSSEKPGAVELKDTRLSLTTDLMRKNVPALNIVGMLEGNDPQLKNEVIVVGAHYDHLGRGGDGSLAPRSGDIHHGADDNASGVAGVIELARIFASHRKDLRRTLVFIAFSGEEEGLIGSNYYVNHPAFPLANTIAMVNMDMIGRLKDAKLTVGGVGTATDFRTLVSSTNTVSAPDQKGKSSAPDQSNAPGLFKLALNDDGFGPSDHSSFYGKQIPVLFLFTGTHDDYHKPTDTADKINYAGEADVVGFVRDLIWSLDKAASRPTYTLAKSASPSGGAPGFRVYLGTIPNYADSDDGLLLDGVRDASPASAAGLKAGDKVVRIGTRAIKNVYDYTYALGEMKPGETDEIEVIRDGQHLILKIVPAARK